MGIQLYKNKGVVYSLVEIENVLHSQSIYSALIYIVVFSSMANIHNKRNNSAELIPLYI